MTKYFIAIPVIVLCVVLIIIIAHGNGYRNGFVAGRRFVLIVLRYISPEAAAEFRRDTIKQYNYDIFGEIERRDE